MREWKSQGYSSRFLLAGYEAIQSEHVGVETFLGMCVRKAVDSILDMFETQHELCT